MPAPDPAPMTAADLARIERANALLRAEGNPDGVRERLLAEVRALRLRVAECERAMLCMECDPEGQIDDPEQSRTRDCRACRKSAILARLRAVREETPC